MKADGSGKRQLTNLNAASFARRSSRTASGLFRNQRRSTRNGKLELYNDQRGCGRVSSGSRYFDGFDGFPMFKAQRKATGVDLPSQRQGTA